MNDNKKFYTRYGSEVMLLGWAEKDWLGDDEWVTIQYDDESTKTIHLSDLRADGGLTEIIEYLHAVTGVTETDDEFSLDDLVNEAIESGDYASIKHPENECCPDCGGFMGCACDEVQS